MKKLIFLIVLPMLMAISGCSDDNNDVEKVEMQPGELQLTVGSDYQLKVLIPKEFSEFTPSWTSEDEEIAVVDENGVVTAVASGVTNVRALVAITCDESTTMTAHQGVCTVTVTDL